MISRRDFHKGMIGLALAGLASGRASAVPVSEDTFYLNRLTFGASPHNRKEFARLGLVDWLEAELKKPLSDPSLDARLARATLHIEYEADETDEGLAWDAVDEMRPYQYLNADTADMLDLLDYEKPVSYAERERPAEEVIAASFLRATHADAQLRELMTQFWHEHFSVNANKDEGTTVFFALYDQVMRRNALGNFRELLGEVAKSPAMLNYLNNADSQASPANENYARELMELHTLGAEHYYNDLYNNWHEVPKGDDGVALGYIDQDVYEVARAFTGWTIGDGRWIEDGTESPLTGKFYFAESWHDPYQKRVLGVEFDSNRGPMEDGEQVLDILANHPNTARFVSRKILRRLGIETPSDDYLAAIADVFYQHRNSPDQIAQVVRAVVLHPEFAETPAQKLRRPLEYVIAMFRATGAEVNAPQSDFYWVLMRSGWKQHNVAPPTGHSDKSADWANTRALNGMVDLALNAHNDMFEGVDFNPVPPGVKTWGEMAKYWVDRLGAPPETVEIFLSANDAGFDETLPFDDEWYLPWASSAAIGMAALSPEFMFR